jgi:hypothetical protein
MRERGGVMEIWKARKNLRFLKKKKQKDFYPLQSRCGSAAGSNGREVLGFFFSEKNMLPHAATT